MHPALGQGCGDHLDSRSHYLGGLSCWDSCLLLYLGLHLLHLRLYLWLLYHHWSSNEFQLWLLLAIQHLSREGWSLGH